MLTLRQFEVFAAVVEAGSFRRCADIMDIAQVSISDHIRALEKSLGVSLFLRRQGAAAQLTPMGEQVYAHVRDILGGVGRLRAECGVPALSARKVRIGAHSLLISRLPHAAAAFIERHPDRPVTFDNMDYEELRTAIDGGEVEAGIFFSLEKPAGLAASAVAIESLAIFAAPDHPLAGARNVSPAQLSEHPFIALSGSAHLRDSLATILGMRGISGMPVALQSDNFSVIVEAARRGIGWICAFRATVTPAMGLQELTLSSPLPPLAIYIAPPPADIEDPVLSDLISTLIPCFQAAAG